ncbi:hypothetical protein BKI52_23975 [marine bacterium AO1-C]|nr:hypothetical protein BKI52_23975 [marine bacterium AO1-C]
MKYLTLLLIFSNCWFAKAQTVETDLQKMGLKHLVKKVTDSIVYTKKGGAYQINHEHYVFDRHGFMTEKQLDAKWAIQKFTPKYFNGKIIENRKTGYRYNKQGKVKLEYSINANGKMSSKSTYEYDVKGRLIKQKSYIYEGGTTVFHPETDEYEFIYDSKSRVIQVNHSESSHPYKLIIYDDKARTKTTKIFRLGDRLYIMEVIQYDQKGNPVKETLKNYTNSEDASIILKKYDAYNNLIEKQYYASAAYPKPYGIINYKYDQHQQLIEHIEFNYKQEIITKDQYKYDNYNNWIQKIAYWKDRYQKTIYRTIEYFDK